jgi:DNA-nicking Smr family endonuclease
MPDDGGPDGDPLPEVRLEIGTELDLHTFAPSDIASVVGEYVREAHQAGLQLVRLIHGRGRGVQRGIVQAALERHPLVVEFWDDAESHLGATFARLGPKPGTSVA